MAGGPLANLIVLFVLYEASLLVPSAYEGLEPFGFAEAAGAALTLFPMRQTLNGQKVPTDGLRLFRLVTRRHTADLDRTYAKLLRTVQTEDAPPHPFTPRAPEILYQALRQDRWTEAWACRDAVAGYRALLGMPDLTADEQAFVLCDLVVQHLLLGYPGVPEDEIGAWASRAQDLSRAPRAEAVRGAVLVATGHLVEGKSILLDAVVALKDRGEILSATSALAHASIGKASAILAGRSGAGGWFDIARTICGSLAVGRAIARGIVRMERDAFADPVAPEARRVRSQALAGRRRPTVVAITNGPRPAPRGSACTSCPSRTGRPRCG